MKKPVLSVLIVLSLLGGWALLKKRPSPVSKAAITEEEELASQKPRATLAASSKASQQQASSLAPAVAAASAKAPGPATALKGIGRPVPPETLKELQDFHNWHAKPFLNSEEERQKKEMLLDPGFLRKLGDLLVTTEMMSDPKFAEAENAAMDFLMESLKNGDHEATVEVIQNIIRDNQVESEKLPQEVREVLAGVKGEVLYNAVALAPQDFANVASLLPGPVSQKIWANVQAKHQQNLADSQAEAQQYQSQKRQHN